LSSVVKTFQFVTDAEGWVPTVSEPVVSPGFTPGVVAAWFPPHKGGTVNHHNSMRADPPLSLWGGCLRMTQRSHETPASNNYWEWAGTWEDLGVPAGQTVTAVEAEYLFRVICYSTYKHQSYIEFGAASCGSGPFELLDDDEVLVGTFSTRQFAPARNNEEGLWRRWPVSPAWPYDGSSHTDYPLQEIPPAWGQVVSDSVAVPSQLQASGSNVRFRLRNLLPETGAGVSQWVRLKQDHIVITVTYGTTEAGTLTLVLGF
jgi:hypothetical protein